MKFKNVENRKVVLPNDETIWISRAVAVVGTVVLIKGADVYFLLSQRGKGAADYHDKWNLPCGYLDWNETSDEAFIREVWEECGINIYELKNISINNLDYKKNPWDVNTSPDENRQNVCLHHGIICNVNYLPIPNIKNEVEDDEVSDVKWVSIKEYENYDYAFGHKEVIKKFIDKHFLDLIK